MRGNSSTSNSKTLKLLKFLKLSFFALAVFTVYVYLSHSYEYAASKNKINEWNKQRFDDFYATKKNSLDLVFIGSSHSYCTFDPELFDSALGINSFQMGMPLQLPDGSYYTLQEILESQAPRAVVMELYFGVLDKPFDLKQAEALFLVMKNERLKAEYMRNVFGLGEKIKYYLKPIRYQQDFLSYKNKELLSFLDEKFGLKAKKIEQTGEEYYKTKGFIYCDYNIPPEKIGVANQFNGYDGKNWSFNDKQKQYVEKIIDLCKQKDITLLFTTAPLANTSLERITNYSAIYNSIKTFADKHGVLYFDFNTEAEIFKDADFRDDAHLNYTGAQKAARFFIESAYSGAFSEFLKN